ncbi:5-oxoprolinase subunit PxpA [Agarivorans sp. 1_MG-2023]|uniref:5-oxoprolinase subunit PxpA n=1 Tax=Agarivorans sp. 1_MG-2023 TaxID=3062634 RepID=UPI0026E1B7BA|nr:5-oxoprolinase subunit PxpA [Agarivorans sp. 1_MG-2023]MDO6765319.1 5-oxoprolinase subunit PxpA [Agarivorans sp. 1_MG-2023]
MLLNCDMGESFGVWKMGIDEQVMPHIDMANIACGGHASDPDVMSNTLALAKQHNVSVGAHPSYADIAGFGRRSIPYQPDQLTHLVLAQVGSLQALCHYHQLSLHYVKPHGALYNDMHKEPSIFESVVKAVGSLDGNIKLMVHATQSAGFIEKIAESYRIDLIKEAFCDRRYLANGQLQARSEAGAVITEQSHLIDQVTTILCNHKVVCADGSELALKADTLCVHGDNQAALDTIKQIKQHIIQANRGS